MTHEQFNLPQLSRWYKKIYLNYAQQVLEAQHAMTSSTGKNILHYTLKKKNKFEHMSHYPKGDRIDLNTGAQYFYHCHRENYDTTEHGHFHCFFRYKQIPKRIKPVPLADWDKYIDSPMTHIVAISMNQLGQPIRLFTVNRWVTSEILYSSEHTSYFVDHFKMTLRNDLYWQILDKWVEGILHLFKPQIIWLQQERDRIFLNHQLKDSKENPYIDHKIEELSEISIDLKQQIEWLIN